MFASWTIRRRLLVGFLGIAAITAVLGGVGYYAAMVANQAVGEIGLIRLPSVQSLLVISEAQTAIDAAENALLARKLTPELRRAQRDRFDTAKARADAAWRIYEALPQTPEEAGVWKQFVPAWERWWADHEKYVALADAFDQAPTDEGYDGMSDFALTTIGESFGAAESLLNKLVETNAAIGQAATGHAKSRAELVKLVTLVTAIAGFLLAVGAGLGAAGA
jgi:methyl-accepting chemotaxis protein